MINKDAVERELSRELGRRVEGIVKRDVKIKKVPGKALTIIGPRRAGKTYLMFSMRRENFLHMNLESLAFSSFKVEDFDKVYDIATEICGTEPEQIFIDEIQTVEKWEKMVRHILDSYDAELIISGSSSKLLSHEIATSLRGRTLTHLLLPFSFKEFVRAKKGELKKHEVISKQGTIKKLLGEYMRGSSYPEVVISGNMSILREYFTTILYRDFVDRFGIENKEAAKLIFEFAYQNFASEFSIRKIHNYVSSIHRVAKNTLYKYVSLVSETMNIFFLDKFDKSPYKRSSWPKKLYVADHGFSSILGQNDIGRKLENIVFLHYLRGTNENPLRTIYFVKTQTGKEVDFLIRDSPKNISLVQVTAAKGLDEIDGREINNLVDVSKFVKSKNLIIISWDVDDEIKEGRKKVRIVPAWRFLMGV